MTLLTVLILFLFFVLSLCPSSFGKKYSWVFPLLHFFTGFLLAFLFNKYFGNKIAVLFLVFCVGLLWEIYEIAVDKIKFLKNVFKKYLNIADTSLSLKDTLADLVLDISGAILFLLIK